MTHKTHSVLVYDLGLFVETAVRLARDFGKVYYYCPGAEATTPQSNPMMTGLGIPGVKTVDYWQDIIDDVDLVVFPDVSSGPVQMDMVKKYGKRVWGSRMGEKLELDREWTKILCKNLGLHVGRYEVVTGIEGLQKYLATHKNQWVKVSRVRGDCESFFAKDLRHAQPKIDEMNHTLGPIKSRKMEFVCEDSIDDAVEVGYDGYSVDGLFPKSAVCGIEVKDKGYIGIFEPEGQMPKQIRDMNAALAPVLADFGYKNFFAVEARITEDGIPWVIDPCCRQGSPPSELLLEMYTNLADIFWYGSEGKCIDPVPRAKWGAELIIESNWAEKNWQPIDFPKKYRDQIKVRFLTVDDGEYYCVPQVVGCNGIGSVVGWGDTLDAAIEHCREAADQVSGYFVDIHSESLDEANDELEHLAEFGIKL